MLSNAVARVNGDNEGHCIWNKVCYESENGKKFNCAYNGTGFPLEDVAAQEIMLQRCPDVYTSSKQQSLRRSPQNEQFIYFFFSADDLLCCDSEMINIMEANFQMAASLFGRCDTCMKNFRKSICAFNCSPKQSDFLTPYYAEIEGNLIT